jgi:hypothetical protein
LAEERVKPFLAHKNPKVRDAANTGYLGSGGVDVLAVSLASSDQKVRREAAAGVFNRDYYRSPLKPAEIATIAKYAADEDVEVRLNLIQGLTKAKQTSHIIPTLVGGLASENEAIQGRSAAGLAVAGPGVAKHLPAIIAAADKMPPGPVKAWLLLAMGEAGAEAKPALPTIFAALKEKDDETRAAATQAMIKAGAADPAEAVKQVRPLVNDNYAYTRDAANKVITTWAKIDVAEVTRLLRDREFDNAMKALEFVHKMGPEAKPLIPELFALADRASKTRDGVNSHTFATALVAIGPDVVPVLIETMKSTNRMHRHLSALALQYSRLDALDAIPVLRAGVLDQDLVIRYACAGTLANMGYRACAAVPDLIQSIVKFGDSAQVIAAALCWVGATGDDAKKLIEMAKNAPAAPDLKRARMIALGGAGKDAIPTIEDLEKRLNQDDPLREVLAEAKWFADRERVLEIQLDTVADKAAKTPHEAALKALKYEMNADQKKKFVAGLVLLLETRPASIQVEALRCLGWIGPEAADALPAIEKLSSSPDEAVKLLVKRTSQRIRK